MMFFGYQVNKKPFLSYSVVSKEGKLTKTVEIEQGNFGTMVHDFAITENYSIFLLFPLQFNPIEMLNGNVGFSLNKKVQARICVIPRHGDSKDTRYFDISNGYVFHTVNGKIFFFIILFF